MSYHGLLAESRTDLYLLVFQCVGGAFFVAAGQSAFVNELIIALPSHAPGIDSATVIATGATEIRTAFSSDVVPGIVESYMAGIKVALALPIGGSGLGLLVSLFSSWQRINASPTEIAAA